MLLERTITQLDTGPMPPDDARHLGELGYMQWMAGLPGRANYADAARHALDRAAPFEGTSPAVAVFCALLRTSLDQPLTPLPLTLPRGKRRGGAGARRQGRMPLPYPAARVPGP